MHNNTFQLRLITEIAAALLSAICLASTARADEAAKDSWTLVIENDLFAGTDRHYTNGVHLSWIPAAENSPITSGELASWPIFNLLPEGERRIGFGIGQSMFVPNDISIREAQPNERPWAGYLYGGVTLLSKTTSTLDILKVDIGVVGPASLAKQSQKLWHEMIDTTKPAGWDNQLKNEPTIALMYERKWRHELWCATESCDGLGLDVTPLVGVALGNVFTYASSGLALRFGDDLRSDFGPPRIRPSLPGSGLFDLDDRFGWQAFVSAEGRAVARNIFLDGNTFTDSASVDKLPFVADFQIGLSFMINSARVTIAQVYRTREYRTQNEPDRFGVISLTFKY